MLKKIGGIQQKLIITMLIVGMVSAVIVLLIVYLEETRTVGKSIGDVLYQHTYVGEVPEVEYSHIYSTISLWKVFILGPSAIGILILLSYFAARWISEPIKELSSGVERMVGSGHLDHNIKIKTGDELEKLAEGFNRMAKDLEDKLHEIKLERDKLNTVMDSLGDGLVLLDESYKIQYMNATFIYLYGKGSIGKNCREVFGVGGMPCKGCSQKNRDEHKPHTIEATTNKGLTYLITHSCIKNLDGSISIVEIFKDITIRKRLEQQLLYSERLAALSQFSSTFAHDLRNPIVAIKKTLEMLNNSAAINKDDENSSPLFKGGRGGVYIDLIANCDLLLGLVNDVLDIHQVSYKNLPLIYSSFSIGHALEEVVRLLRIEAEERKLNVIIENDHDIHLNGDKRRIQRVFINLLSNAIRYSPPEGKIKMSFTTEEESSNLLFKIEDDGPGIAPAELTKVFDIFYKKEMNGIKGGTGLGLYFCKVVVDAHGGRIWAGNRENGGAVFYLSIPINVETTREEVA
ncbi:MAG: HAMP domain-containing protein [Nitrospirae bacterium]|nr:HAMP domain-containing protein [Nitrospirota bacterium]